MTTEYVDLTPTWTDILPALLAVVANPEASPESRTVVHEELWRMADLADRWREQRVVNVTP